MPQQMGLTLLGAFGLLALGLSAIGIYSVGAYVALQRTREIGIRLALGAEARHVRQLVLRHGVVPAAAGMVAGVGLALWAARFARAFLYDVSPNDPLTFAAVSAGAVARCWTRDVGAGAARCADRSRRRAPRALS